MASNKLNNSTILKKTKKSLPNKKSSGILSDRDGMVIISNDVNEQYQAYPENDRLEPDKSFNISLDF